VALIINNFYGVLNSSSSVNDEVINLLLLSVVVVCCLSHSLVEVSRVFLGPGCDVFWG
jgi:hypothetical protein